VAISAKYAALIAYAHSAGKQQLHPLQHAGHGRQV
jgi:hypothetical protein